MKILLPYDGSPHSRAAVEFVARRPALIQQAAAVTLLSVQTPVPSRAAVAMGRRLLAEYYAKDAQRVLGPARRLLEDAGLTVKALGVAGNAVDRIVRTAASERSDLIVMGSHGRTARANAFLGSVATGVIADSKVPVLLIRRTSAAPRGALSVGLAWDGSRYSRAALDFVIAHADLFGAGARLAIAHVVNEVPIQVKLALSNLTSTEFTQEKVRAMCRQAFDKAMAPARKALAKAGLPVREQMLVGSNPGEELAAWARRDRLDLLVMGSHGLTALRTLWVGSVVARVGARCDTPLLIVRPG
jgi:nucleotide-binding universal stress UspA family protein